MVIERREEVVDITCACETDVQAHTHTLARSRARRTPLRLWLILHHLFLSSSSGREVSESHQSLKRIIVFAIQRSKDYAEKGAHSY